jgi:uncharacterized SAM-binding protein YcdF (DUF218 family)
MRPQDGFSSDARVVSVQRIRQRTVRSRRRSFPWSLIVLPLVIWLGVRAVRIHFEQPNAILVLGGGTEREKFAADFALQHPDLPIWISSGTPEEYATWLFAETGVSLERLRLDYEAVDTVTNFTSLADRLKEQGIKKVYLVTSDYHMRRARVIGEIVLGSRGISMSPVAVQTGKEEEPLSKAVRDGGRALLWVVTGRTGSTLVYLKDKN